MKHNKNKNLPKSYEKNLKWESNNGNKIKLHDKIKLNAIIIIMIPLI